MIARIWARLIQPTLMRRMLLGQMLLLTMLWSLLVAFIIYESLNDKALLKTDSIYDTFLAAADSLAGQPDRRNIVIGGIDRMLQYPYNRGEADPHSKPEEVGSHIEIVQGGQVVYRSDHMPSGVRSTGVNEIEEIDVDGIRWRTRSRQSSKTGTRVTIAQPANAWRQALIVTQRGFYLLPLVVCLPFLMLPAWLAIRIGLKPWSRVAREVAESDPQDLTLLSSRPKHLELRSIVDNINMLLARVKESTQRERSFIAEAAHELRTPLAALRINVEALQRQQNDERQSGLLSGVLNSTDRTTRLVCQLLQMMRSDANNQLALERLPFHVLLQDRLAVLSALAKARSIELELQSQDRVWVMGQREGLESLIDNLVENAIKYSPEKGIVTVSLTLVGGQAVLHVADRGAGIPEALRERVFDRFFRASDQSEAGSGLGLAIVQSVAQQHGGKVVLHDAPGGAGLLVVVMLPAIV